MARVVDALTQRAIAGAGIGLAGYRYLEALRVEGPRSAGSLAALVGVRPSSVSRACGRLVDRGLVAAEPDPSDGRARRLASTEAGDRLVQVVQARLRRELRRVVATVPVGSEEALVRGLGRLSAAACGMGDREPEDR